MYYIKELLVKVIQSKVEESICRSMYYIKEPPVKAIQSKVE